MTPRGPSERGAPRTVLSLQNRGQEIQWDVLVSGRKYISFIGLWANLILSLYVFKEHVASVCKGAGYRESTDQLRAALIPVQPVLS